MKKRLIYPLIILLCLVLNASATTLTYEFCSINHPIKNSLGNGAVSGIIDSERSSVHMMNIFGFSNVFFTGFSTFKNVVQNMKISAYQIFSKEIWKSSSFNINYTLEGNENIKNNDNDSVSGTNILHVSTNESSNWSNSGDNDFIPGPTTLLLLGTGLIGFASVGRRQQNR